MMTSVEAAVAFDVAKSAAKDTPLKFCKDCEHLEARTLICMRIVEPLPGPDLVTGVAGKPMSYRFPAHYERGQDVRVHSSGNKELCGPDGKFWTAKLTKPA